MRRLVENKDRGARLRIAVLGCSIGVEVYSILWTLRRSRPDLELDVRAVDISPEVVEVAQRGVYSPAASELVSASIFDGLDRGRTHGDVRLGRRRRPRSSRGFATESPGRSATLGDPNLITSLGPQDLVIASNFLCHMDPRSAESCLRNLARLVKPRRTPVRHRRRSGCPDDSRARARLGADPGAQGRDPRRRPAGAGRLAVAVVGP